jgi:hypothetical protein
MAPFYQEAAKIDPRLRQGDIFKGLISTTVVFDKRAKSEPAEGATEDLCPISEYVTAEQTELCMKFSDNLLALITPCCNVIKDEALLFCPLVNVPSRLTEHEFFKTNPSLVNQKWPAELAIPPAQWKLKLVEEQEKLKRDEPGYAFETIFFYEQNGDILKRPYVINFARTFSFRQPNSFGHPPALTLTKYRILQLTKETRDLLSEKISTYYTNTTD